MPGHIYVAPPDNHLTLRPGAVQVVRGPKENGHRPSVDALFRTASTAYGARVVGVVLSGHLDCGTAGLLSVKARGGIAIVQDPGDAAVSAMPSAAIRHVDVDRVAAVRDIPALIAGFVSEPAPPEPKQLPATLAAIEGTVPGKPADIVCPICHGRLTETESHGFHVFRCHVGHSFSLESIAAEQAEEVERALWSAARSLEESASLSARLAGTGGRDLGRRFAEKAQAQLRDAGLIRQILLSGGVLDRVDADRLEARPTRGAKDRGAKKGSKK
jgi:two-component system chemotaxis response regulator CheB